MSEVGGSTNRLFVSASRCFFFCHFGGLGRCLRDWAPTRLSPGSAGLSRPAPSSISATGSVTVARSEVSNCNKKSFMSL